VITDWCYCLWWWWWVFFSASSGVWLCSEGVLISGWMDYFVEGGVAYKRPSSFCCWNCEVPL